MSRITKQIEIDNLKAILETERATVREIARENEFLLQKFDLEQKRIVELTTQNESLKSDKAWLKQMHSALLQATAEMFRNR